MSWFSKNWFKLSILLIFLVIALSVGYYYVYYLPQQGLSSQQDIREVKNDTISTSTESNINENFNINENTNKVINNANVDSTNNLGNNDNDKLVSKCIQQPINLQSECISEEAIKQNDYLICNNILKMDYSYSTALVEVDNCIKEVATNYNDEFLCVKIKNQLIKDYCYRTIAIKLKDYTLCDNIINNNADPDMSNIWNQGTPFNQTVYFKDMCYYPIAVTTNNLSICEKIQDPETKEMCNFQP